MSLTLHSFFDLLAPHLVSGVDSLHSFKMFKPMDGILKILQVSQLPYHDVAPAQSKSGPRGSENLLEQ